MAHRNSHALESVTADGENKADSRQDALFCWIGIYINKLAGSFHGDLIISGSMLRDKRS